MTIQDIKKALEFCAQDNYYFCGGCSYDDVRNCNDKLKTDALNVIIEQEREIERLKAEVKQAKLDVLKELKTRHDYANMTMGYPWDISQQIDELIAEVENASSKGTY